MQDAVQAVGAGGGRIFSGVCVEDRRLRPHSSNHHGQQQAALKCPRCESPNTKFCYYNNYNLSQPRHLCKSCRRYWTNGGVLRNVPVGGGCRKAKRSSSSAKAAKKDHVSKSIQPDSTATANKILTSIAERSEHEKTAPAENNQAPAVENFSCTMMPSREEDLMGPFSDHHHSYEEEFKVVDNGDYSTLFNYYWDDQSTPSLNFLP